MTAIAMSVFSLHCVKVALSATKWKKACLSLDELSHSYILCNFIYVMIGGLLIQIGMGIKNQF